MSSPPSPDPKLPGPQPLKTSTSGPVAAVPCPWCGASNDFRPQADESQGGEGWGGQGLQAGSLADCDACGRTSKIVSVKTMTIVQLAAHRQ